MVATVVLRSTLLYFGILSTYVRKTFTDARLGNSFSCFDIGAFWRCRCVSKFGQHRILVVVNTPVIFQPNSVGFRRWQPSGAVKTPVNLSEFQSNFVELASWAAGNPRHRLFPIFHRRRTLSQPNEWVYGTTTQKVPRQTTPNRLSVIIRRKWRQVLMK